MNNHSISELVNRWDLSGLKTTAGENYNQVHERLAFLRKHLYDQYVPTQGSEHADYETRLEHWLGNVNDDNDKRILFELAPHITFFTREDFLKLNQAAVKGPITRWLIDLLDLPFNSPKLKDALYKNIHEHTWYCPITDSMQISEFHHANNIGGVDFRPDWRSLLQFGDPAKIVSFMENHKVGGKPCPLTQIVLLEDFVGSGTQIRFPDLAAFIDTFPQKYPVLFAPLIICPEGAKYARDLAKKYSWFRFTPLLELTSEQCITDINSAQPGTLEKAVHDLILKTYPLVLGNKEKHPRPYHPFGFHNTGALVVMFSNTPANTLPIIQHHSDKWNPLFRRSARIQ